MAAQHQPEMQDRAREREALDRLLKNARRGRSEVLVIRGEAGVGKTALLQYVAAQASDFRVAEVAGVEAERELSFAALHQLCAPMLAKLDTLPGPQQDALRVAFGLSSGETPDRFLVALAALSLLSEVAEERPLLCLVEDAQWLDATSGQVLGFVARRLVAESMAIVFAMREPSLERHLVGLPDLRLVGLEDHDARALLQSVFPGRLDVRVRDRIIAETRGNPLALVELPRGLTAADLAGGFTLSATADLPAYIEDHYLRRIGALPEVTRRLLLLAAADPVGDAPLFWRAAEWLGLDRNSIAPAEEEDLLRIGIRVTFRHPLVRSAVYRAASASDRQNVHAALAAVTDQQHDPDRRAWHRAQTTSRPDEEIAGELERSAERAQARGGLAAAGAFLQRAYELTPAPTRRAERALAAAQAKVHSGDHALALQLLSSAEAGPLTEANRARIDLVSAQLAFVSNRGNDASPLLLKAARRLEQVDIELARLTYLDALIAALFAGRLAKPEADLRAVAAAAAALPAPQSSSKVDLLLEGLATSYTVGYRAGLPLLRRALVDFDDVLPSTQALRWLSLAYAAAVHIWEDERSQLLSSRWVALVRDVGALSELPLALTGPIMVLAFKGELAKAASVAEELQAATDATQCYAFPHGPVTLAAYRGDRSKTTELIGDAIATATERGEGYVISSAEWASAVLNNGLGRYAEALAAAQHASQDVWEPGFSNWALIELIEAATHNGSPELGRDAFSRLADMTSAAGTDWALGIEARSHALLAKGSDAENFYRTAIELLGRTSVRAEHARAYLLYGEWLNRQNRRTDARDQLRTAHEMLSTMGMAGFAERARKELLATGEKVRKRRDDTRVELTPQEYHIATLARAGRTNAEIGTEMFISARTVEFHLKKVFTKLGISSRRALQDAMDGGNE